MEDRLSYPQAHFIRQYILHGEGARFSTGKERKDSLKFIMILGLPKASVSKLVSWLSVTLAFHNMEPRKNRALRDQKVGKISYNKDEKHWFMCKNHLTNKRCI